MAPTNISFLTATDIPTFPATITQDVLVAGVAVDVFYKFTAPAGATAMLAYAFGSLTDYLPVLEPYLGPAGAPTSVLGISARNLPCQFPVTAGSEYFLEIDGAAATVADLQLAVSVAPNETIFSGDLVINDDRSSGGVGFPCVVLNQSTGAVRRIVFPVATGTWYGLLPSGHVILQDNIIQSNRIYSPQLALVATPTMPYDRFEIVASNNNDTFYAIRRGNAFGGPANATLVSIAVDGTVGPDHDLGVTGAGPTPQFAVDPTDTYAYLLITDFTKIKKFVLASDTYAADFATAGAGYTFSTDIYVLTDGTILVGYTHPLATYSNSVRHYSAAGALLHEIVLPASPALHRFAVGADDPLSFWEWTQTAQTATDAAFSTFTHYLISDGSVLATRTGSQFRSGVLFGPSDGTGDHPPDALSGHSDSCPIWIARQTGVTTTTYPIRRQRRFLLPSSPDNKRVQIPMLELLMRTGIGLTPGDDADPPVLGSDPQVMLRISKDGGKTWGPEQWRTAGAIGRFANRVRWLRTPNQYRNAVVEITVSDPVDWQFLAMLGDVTEGSS